MRCADRKLIPPRMPHFLRPPNSTFRHLTSSSGPAIDHGHVGYAVYCERDCGAIRPAIGSAVRSAVFALARQWWVKRRHVRPHRLTARLARPTSSWERASGCYTDVARWPSYQTAVAKVSQGVLFVRHCCLVARKVRGMRVLHAGTGRFRIAHHVDCHPAPRRSHPQIDESNIIRTGWPPQSVHDVDHPSTYSARGTVSRHRQSGKSKSLSPHVDDLRCGEERREGVVLPQLKSHNVCARFA